MRSSITAHFQQFMFQQFRINETKLHELNYLFWECTKRCNLNCLHCGSDCSSESRVADMPFSDFLQAILPLKEKFKRDSITVVITGGEPLMRKDLAECGLALRENGFRWGIVTNGYSYSEKIHGRLLAAGMGAITLSLDGLSQNHNWLRKNQNCFIRAVQALELITSSDRLNFDIVTCVNSRNLDELPTLLDFLVEKKVKAWRLFTIAPIGRASHKDELQLDKNQLINLMDFIVETRKKKLVDIKFSCESFVGKYERKVRDSSFFCRAGINIASVLVDGAISACPNINRHFAQGNIYTDDLLTIWETRFEIMRNRAWTKVGHCLNCSDYTNCNGGAMHLWDENADCILSCINHSMNEVTN